MNIGMVLEAMFPEAVPNKDYVVMDIGEGPFIESWNIETSSQPSNEELMRVWEQIKMNPVEKPLDPIEQLQKDQADLMLALVMKGVI